MRDSDAGHGLGRQGAGADLAFAGDGEGGEAGADGLLERRAHPVRQRREVLPVSGEEAERRQALGEAVGVAVEAQRRLQRGEADLVDAHGALHRVAVDQRHEIAAADDEAGLRSAKQLVAGEGDEVGALCHRLRDGRLARQAVGARGRPACPSRGR